MTDLEVNLVTIGLPGGSGTSVRSKKNHEIKKEEENLFLEEKYIRGLSRTL